VATLDAGLALARSLGLTFNIVRALVDLAHVAIDRGDYEAADKFLGEATPMARDSVVIFLGSATGALGRLAFARGDIAAAESYFRDALAMTEAFETRFEAVWWMTGLGRVELAKQQADTARGFFERGLESAEALGNAYFMAFALQGLGQVARADGDPARAVSFHRRAVGLLVPGEAPTVIVTSLEEVGGVAAESGHPELAARLLGAAESIRNEFGYVRGSVEGDRFARDVATARRALGDSRFRAAWAAGIAMSLEEGVQLLSESYPRV
jgi:tetratricopeptide (TPR) repeat protein